AFRFASTSEITVAMTSSQTGKAWARVIQMLSRPLRVDMVDPECGPAPVVSTPKTTMTAVSASMIQASVGSGDEALVGSLTPVSSVRRRKSVATATALAGGVRGTGTRHR